MTEAYERILSDPASAGAIAKAMIRLARKGNVQAAREIADRVEGKVNSTESEQKQAPIVVKIARDPETPAISVPEQPALDVPGRVVQ